MAVYLENTRETQKVNGKDVPKGGKVEIDDPNLVAFMIRRRGFKRVEQNNDK